MTSEQKIFHDPQYIAMRRFEFSIDKLMKRYPDGVPDNIVATALGIKETDILKLEAEITQKLKDLMGV